jgi:hypothetical protein
MVTDAMVGSVELMRRYAPPKGMCRLCWPFFPMYRDPKYIASALCSPPQPLSFNLASSAGASAQSQLDVNGSDNGLH